jgi:cytochrome c5
MDRVPLLLLTAALALPVGCSRNDENASLAPVAAPESVRAESWREDQLLTGKETYEAACASCHNPGESDAPSIGDQTEWSGRSDLWTAVLAEHASAGYLKMPEKGGHSELSEEQVSAALEYMLWKTFPELPRD